MFDLSHGQSKDLYGKHLDENQIGDFMNENTVGENIQEPVNNPTETTTETVEHVGMPADSLIKIDTMLNENLCVDAQNVLKIVPDIVKLQDQKAKLYGRSWCRHGELSALFNMERKWDRISNVMEKCIKDGTENTIYAGKAETATESFIDTLVDLSVYSLMLVGYIRENHPEEYEKFLKNNKLQQE